ncbi:MAG TPA: DinB family protein [Ktedonobacterales bacterium]
MATPQTPPLIRYYSGWKHYHQLLRDHVAARSAEELRFQAAPALRPAWLLVTHIISVRAGWLHDTLGESDASFGALHEWQRDKVTQRSSAELLEGLDRTWAVLETCLTRWTEADLDATFDDDGETVTRGWVVWHVLEHDLHHGGEYFFTMGMQGIEGPDL